MSHQTVATTPDAVWERVGFDRYEVSAHGVVLGYVEVVGPVFVAHAGPTYSSAVEVAQTLIFDRAVAAVLAA